MFQAASTGVIASEGHMSDAWRSRAFQIAPWLYRQLCNAVRSLLRPTKRDRLYAADKV